jgi:hypothetical protein
MDETTGAKKIKYKLVEVGDSGGPEDGPQGYKSDIDMVTLKELQAIEKSAVTTPEAFNDITGWNVFEIEGKKIKLPMGPGWGFVVENVKQLKSIDASFEETEAAKKLKDVKGDEPDEKDLQRLADIEDKAAGDVGKAIKMAVNVAKSIRDYDKAVRRAKAAEIVFKDEKIGKAIHDVFMQAAHNLLKVAAIVQAGIEVRDGKVQRKSLAKIQQVLAGKFKEIQMDEDLKEHLLQEIEKSGSLVPQIMSKEEVEMAEQLVKEGKLSKGTSDDKQKSAVYYLSASSDVLTDVQKEQLKKDGVEVIEAKKKLNGDIYILAKWRGEYCTWYLDKQGHRHWGSYTHELETAKNTLKRRLSDSATAKKL